MEISICFLVFLKASLSGITTQSIMFILGIMHLRENFNKKSKRVTLSLLNLTPPTASL